MYNEVFEGMTYTNEEIAKMFGTTFEEEDYVDTHKNMVIVKIFQYIAIVNII